MHRIVETVLPGELIFDIGANVGAKAALYSSRQAQVIAVEPQPAMVAELRQRFEGNPLVTIVPKGVGAQHGILSMAINSNEPVLSTFSQQWQQGRFAASTWDRQVDVEMTTLDSLVELYGVPRYAKIDVEGYELRSSVDFPEK